MKLTFLLGFAALLGTSAAAGPFDGTYQPAGYQWSCRSDQIGMDGGALSIQGDVLRGVENYCRLTRPTPVRDMNAVLYDAVCSAEGSQYSERVMLMRHRNGVYVMRDGSVADWRPCQQRVDQQCVPSRTGVAFYIDPNITNDTYTPSAGLSWTLNVLDTVVIAGNQYYRGYLVSPRGAPEPSIGYALARDWQCN